MSNNTNGSCSPYADPAFIGVTIASVVSGFISFVASLFVICIILLLRKWQVLVQRLILYLAIAAFISALAVMFHRVDYEGDNPAKDGFCVFAGFFEQQAGWMQLNAVVCITAHLFLCAVLNVRLEKLEPFYFAVIFFLPFAFNWIPLIETAYGRAGAWCWIRSEIESDCSEFLFGRILRFILWYIPLYVILIALIFIYGFILYKLRRSRRHWVGRYDPTTERLKEQTRTEVIPLIWYPFIYLLLNLFPFINRIHNFASPDNPNVGLWYCHAITYPLVGAFIALPFILDPETRQRLRLSSFKAACSELCQKSPEIQEYPLEQDAKDTTKDIQERKSISSSEDSKNSANYESFQDKPTP